MKQRALPWIVAAKIVPADFSFVHNAPGVLASSCPRKNLPSVCKIFGRESSQPLPAVRECQLGNSLIIVHFVFWQANELAPSSPTSKQPLLRLRRSCVQEEILFVAALCEARGPAHAERGAQHRMHTVIVSAMLPKCGWQPVEYRSQLHLTPWVPAERFNLTVGTSAPRSRARIHFHRRWIAGTRRISSARILRVGNVVDSRGLTRELTIAEVKPKICGGCQDRCEIAVAAFGERKIAPG